ncbi:MAG: hypothetical protein AAF512_19795 [Pseudomonadota bacterium]
MKPFQANLVNAILLVLIALWGYFSAVPEVRSLTALIPLAFGVIFLVLTPPFKKDNKVVAHIIVLLTLILILALVMPLRGAIGREDSMGILRVGLMMCGSVFAMVIYIKSFIDVRKAKAAATQDS